MAVAMEVSWRGGEMGSPGRKKRAWGADAQQLMHLMMGQLHSQPAVKPELTLDLLGNTDPSSSCVTQLSGSPDFDLQLHPEEPLPSGWEKCLDLQTGKLYYVNQATGVSSFDDPRKRLTCQGEIELQTQSTPLAHEFLGSKKSETLIQETLKASSSSSSGSPYPNSRDLHSFSTGKQLWNLQLDEHHVAGSGSSPRVVDEDSNLELDLNLAAGRASSSIPSRRPHEQTVCTMQMIENALKRSESYPRLALKRETPKLRHKYSISSSFSSLTNSTRSEPSGASPSTSSSSSATSTSSLPGAARRAPSNPSSTGACTEADSIKVERIVEPAAGALVMGACTRCLMYVMLNKADPRCPRCESNVPVDFSTAPPPCKKQRGGSRR
ncbi:hypothetical protein KC19_6G104600 [Ceratodon purpureus]|uniref:WW domain-containing protein n=2 Tax=Ceratodon purpureus TaxID=3225 RepID=A0A8T0HCV4_CERPU|nr:hypothetical protein KC19_6G104600 [Ceratodon purpureus]